MSFAEGLIGVVLDGRYRLDAVLGEGGMGSVFRATQLAMDRKVAVKLLKPHLTSDEVALKRFAAEARRTMRVDSPHAVKVLDFGVTEARDYYMVLEYLDGRTVQRELEVDGPFAPARVIHIARHALHALGAAHASGLVHRDIKPDNLLLMRAGDDPDFTKVLDFGVAKLMEGAAVSSRSALKLTAQGMVFGTPEFMSPEQACGLTLDGRSDIYALAATMFAMLTGCGLFKANAPIEWLAAHARTPPPHLGAINPALADQVGLDALLQRCLAKRADDRPRDAAELDALLAELERGGGQLPAPAPAPRDALPKTLFSPSGYVEALPPAEDIGRLPTALMRPPTVDPDALPAEPRKRSGLYILLGVMVLAIGGAVGAMVMVSSTSSGAGTATAAAPAAKPVAADASGSAELAQAQVVVDAAVAAPVVDAAVVAAAADAAVLDSAPAAAPAPVPGSAGAPKPKPSTMNQRVVAQHLVAARAALARHNPIAELAHAQEALRLDPSNLQAKFFMGDALLASGDLDNGCRILRNIKKFALAAERMQLAGCPP